MIIGICGRARAGKDTCAKIIADYLSHTVVMGFADPVKAAACYMFGWDDDWLEANKDIVQEDGILPRDVLQKLGTDFARGFDDDIWVKHAMRRVSTTCGYTRTEASNTGLQSFRLVKCDHVVFKDVRFPNEAKAIRERGGILIYKEGGIEMSHLSELYTQRLAEGADAAVSWYDDKSLLDVACAAICDNLVRVQVG